MAVDWQQNCWDMDGNVVVDVVVEVEVVQMVMKWLSIGSGSFGTGMGMISFR